ncbi:helix-turn-helix domain-containing protein [Aeromicrobium sp.]|uniref:helix-turn-helix domain-containing protein n=1 Tax=Aeromicrobium sp. TaxID=1871063 RepID=UPI002FC6F725
MADGWQESRTSATPVAREDHVDELAHLVSAHPNTVDNRMRKPAGLTGYDPTRPDDATRLRMALLARDAEART